MYIRNLVPISGFCLLISVPSVAAHWTGLVLPSAPDKAWWDAPSSGKGLCCSFADGVSIKDVDWDTSPGSAADGFQVLYRAHICASIDGAH